MEPLRQGAIKLQVCPVSAQWERLPDAALRQALEQALACYRAVRDHGSEVALVRTRTDLTRVEQGDGIGLILSMEGAEPLGLNFELADIFWRLGFRMFALTWSRRTAFADGNGEPPHGGLSALGGRLVDRLISLGAIIDLAHANERSFYDVLDRAPRGQVIVSHAACRSLCETPRNLTDNQLRALADHGGLLGIMAIPWLIDATNPTVEKVVDHIEHAIEMMGCDHVGLGGDFFRQVALSGAVRKPPDSPRPPGMGLDVGIHGLSGPEDYLNLLAELERRGYAGEALERLVFGNLRDCLYLNLPEDADDMLCAP